MALDKQQKKELADAYKTSFRRMGIYQIRNEQNGKILIRSSMDLEGTRNRFDFMKQMNSPMFAEFRADWVNFGSGSFVFEELDVIKPQEEQPGAPDEQKKYKDELDTLQEMWIEKLQPYAEKGYHKRKP
ncbi:GIY-YIG nuclease family protein [Gorillibacterium timonense]|uniref:GIY-YIG nuclease family protein n=1 Tax=Gorillibacterium timonense TaxID=1689269 RepID=UPI00071CE2D2|nr:GIY-YIG nuclease family protein [Gorillibacterium timonense]